MAAHAPKVLAWRWLMAWRFVCFVVLFVRLMERMVKWELIVVRPLFNFLLMQTKILIGVLSMRNFGHDFFFVSEVLDDEIEKNRFKWDQSPLARSDFLPPTSLTSFQAIKLATGITQIPQKPLQMGMLVLNQLTLNCYKLSKILMHKFYAHFAL